MAGFNLGQFMVARIMRIWLPYLAVLLISGGFYSYQVSQDFPLTLLSSSAWVQQMWHGHPLTALDMLRESFLLNLPSQVVLLPQAWTLSIELVLSLMLPVALLLLSRNIVWLVLFSFYAVMFLGVSAFLLHFVMGLILARYYGLISMYLLTRPVWRFATLLLGFALYSSANVWKDWLTENQLWLLTGVGASLILMYVFGSSLMQRSLSHPLLRQIGKVSYSAYLIHMLVLICITPLLLKTLELFSQNRLSLWLGGYFLSLLVVHGLSLWFYQKLEMPSISFGRRIGAVLNKD
jgi:peptidoglycan/LPS O-acetylase OafA/YrhL